MTRDQWLEIAGRAGWMQVLWKSQYPEALDCLERFARGVEALVREECAQAQQREQAGQKKGGEQCGD